MIVDFPPVDESYIKRMVDDGVYPDATEVVREAVKRMREQEAEKRNRLLAALKAGQDDLDAGRVTPFTEDFLDRCEERARINLAEGRTPKTDVQA